MQENSDASAFVGQVSTKSAFCAICVATSPRKQPIWGENADRSPHRTHRMAFYWRPVRKASEPACFEGCDIFDKDSAIEVDATDGQTVLRNK